MSVTEKGQRGVHISVTPRRYPDGPACEECGRAHVTKFIDYGDPDALWRYYHVPPRRGRHYCSNACRQKAYRKRKAAA